MTPLPFSSMAAMAPCSCGTAVAAQRAEHVAGQALAVHPDQDVRAARPPPP